MLVAGHETTVHLLGYAIVALAQNPDQLALAKAEDRWADVVEETVRYRHSVMMTSFRFTAEDVTIAGVPSPGQRGGRGLPGHRRRPGGARPERDQFDITRESTGSLGFGHGPRFCIGAGLARLESRVALETLYRRFPDLSLAIDPDDIPYSPSFFTIGPLFLPVNLGVTQP